MTMSAYLPPILYNTIVVVNCVVIILPQPPKKSTVPLAPPDHACTLQLSRNVSLKMKIQSIFISHRISVTSGEKDITRLKHFHVFSVFHLATG